jgi:hypothetical protein
MSHGIVTSLGWLMSLTSKGGKKTEVFYFLLSHHIELPTFSFPFLLGPPLAAGGFVPRSPERIEERPEGGRATPPARPPARRAGRQVLELPSSVSFLSLYLSSSSFVVARLVFFCLGVGYFWILVGLFLRKYSF